MHWTPLAADFPLLAGDDVNIFALPLNVLSFPTIRARSRAGEQYVAHVLGRYVDGGVYGLQFSKTPAGKPILHGNPPALSFNLSYCDTLAVLAVSRTQSVGIDIERVADLPDLSPLLDQLHPEERALIIASPDVLRMFYRVWTRKESLLKAVGKGYFVSPELFSVADIARPITVDGLDWTILELPENDGVLCALTCQAPTSKMSLWAFGEDHPWAPRLSHPQVPAFLSHATSAMLADA